MEFKKEVCFTLLIALCCAKDSFISATNENPTASVESFTIPLKQLKTYQKPTLDELKQCESTREKCIEKCESNVDECLSGCPICPIIISGHAILVQGINDTKLETFDLDTNIQNLTTIVKLTNVVHNIVDIPTADINATNLNHVHIYQNTSSSEGGKFGFGYNGTDACCIAIQPKTCQLSWSGPRCHHKRHKTCGKHCTARIIHVRKRQRCQSINGCSPIDIQYIPQPRIPKCIYLPFWPFVTCGGNYIQQCDGCYDHYDNENIEEEEIPDRCRACYDEAFDYGQFYRRGPVFRPHFYHYPPCFIIGTCGIYGGGMQAPGNILDDGFGTSYGRMFFNPLMYNGFNSYDNSMFHSEEEIGTDMDDENLTNNNFNKFNPDEWELDKRKCKIENENGTVSIVDCTDDPSLLNEMQIDSLNQLQYDEKDTNKKYERYRRMSNPFLSRKRKRRYYKRRNLKSFTKG